MAADRFKTDHTEFHVSPSAVDLIEKLIWHYDGPFGDSSAVPTYLVRGGDGFTAFKLARTLVGEETGPPLAQVVVDAIVVRGTIAPAADGRITRSTR